MFKRLLKVVWGVVVGWGILAGMGANGQELIKAGEPAKGAGAGQRAEAETTTGPKPLTHYMGREIAQTMHFAGAPWLVRESRDREEEPKKLLEALKLKRGMIVCDLGCGNGFYTLPIARLVGPNGIVIGVEIQPEMLEMLMKRAREAGVANVYPVLGTATDPLLPEGKVDLVLLVDVYHELSNPEEVLGAIRKSLAPKGRLVLVEFRAEDPNVPIKPLHKMSKAQMRKELSANGFRVVEEFDGLPWQHVMFFEREGAGERKTEDGR